jgi:hypothetical protein
LQPKFILAFIALNEPFACHGLIRLHRFEITPFQEINGRLSGKFPNHFLLPLKFATQKNRAMDNMPSLKNE